MPTGPASISLEPRAASQLVLASSSPYRRELLQRFGLPFVWQAPAADEHALVRETPLQLVRRLALHKARALAELYPRALIIGSDQLAVLDGRVLGKPGSEERALEQLQAASGRTVQFLTSACVLDVARHSYELAVVASTVRFRHLDRQFLQSYLRREQPFDCAGSFKCEGLGIALFEAISSNDPTALVGLPLISVTAMLARAGLDCLAALP